MKIYLSWALLFGLSLNLYAYTKGKVYKLTILHTNDHHGRFLPNREGELGLAPRATLIRQLREELKNEGRHVLLLDAGDVNTGTPHSDMQDAEPDFKGMAMIGYDVMAVGNHEFDKPLSTIFKQRDWGGFPFISANIYHKNNKERVFPADVEKKVDDLNVRIFGLTTEDTPLKSRAENSKDLYFRPMLEEAKELVPQLRKESDVLIALTHEGHYPEENHGSDAPGDVTLARQVPGIDLIVGGHTQKPIFNADIQNGTIIVQAAEWGKYVGRVDLEFLDGKVTLASYKLIPVNLKDSGVKIEADAEMTAMLEPFKQAGDARVKFPVGQADAKFEGTRDIVRKQETNLGNLVARAYKEKFAADLAITNSGGLRDSIYPGEVTYESVLMAPPFGGEVGTASLSGKELKDYMEYVVFNLTPGSGSFPQMSGIEILANKEEKKIKQILINGQDLDESKSYVLALPDFIASGGDKYPKLSTFRKFGYVDADILKDYIKKICPVVEVRDGVEIRKAIPAQDYAPTGYVKFE